MTNAGTIGCSPLTGNLYIVMKAEELGGGQMVAKEKRVVEREEIGDLVSLPAAHGAARKAYQGRREADA